MINIEEHHYDSFEGDNDPYVRDDGLYDLDADGHWYKTHDLHVDINGDESYVRL